MQQHYGSSPTSQQQNNINFQGGSFFDYRQGSSTSFQGDADFPSNNTGALLSNTNNNAVLTPQSKKRKMHNPYSTDKTTRTVASPLSPTAQGIYPTSGMMQKHSSNNGIGTPSAHSSNDAATPMDNTSLSGLPAGYMLPAAQVQQQQPVQVPLSDNLTLFNNSNNNTSTPTHQQQQTSSKKQQQHQGAYSVSTSPPTATTATTTTAAATTTSIPAPTTMSPQELYDHLLAKKDELEDLARTAAGSSLLQAAIKADSNACLSLIWNRFEHCLGDLMLDANAGYVVRCLLDAVPREDAIKVCERITEDPVLAYSLCTHSLHTRRLVQSIMESIDKNFLSTVLINSCAEIAKTQQGCIVMQRALDHATEKVRARLISAITENIAAFSTDPFANYVVQYLLDTAPRTEAVPMVWGAMKGNILNLSCNKFSSNVIEKFLILADSVAQHELITELYNNDAQSLCRVMQDSFGNYIVQATIARSSFGDLQFINERLRPVLESVPYGSKIAARLDRRLNQPAPSSSSAASNNINNHHHQNHNQYNNINNNQVSNNNGYASLIPVPNSQQQRFTAAASSVAAPAPTANVNNGGQQQQRYNNNNNNSYHHNHHHNKNQHQHQHQGGYYQQQQQPRYQQIQPQQLQQQQQQYATVISHQQQQFYQQQQPQIATYHQQQVQGIPLVAIPLTSTSGGSYNISTTASTTANQPIMMPYSTTTSLAQHHHQQAYAGVHAAAPAPAW